MDMDLMQVIIEHIMKARYEDLSTQTVGVIKKLFLDTLGTIIAGSSAEGSKDTQYPFIGYLTHPKANS